MVIFANLTIFRINVRKNDQNNGWLEILFLQVVDVLKYGALIVVKDLVHDKQVVFISLISHFFQDFSKSFPKG